MSNGHLHILGIINDCKEIAGSFSHRVYHYSSNNIKKGRNLPHFELEFAGSEPH